jgi:myo-inositol-1(or 4)-monophosphatase
MNGEAIKVGQQSDIGDAVVAMGSPPGEESMQMTLKGIEVLMPKVRTIRMFGSAALMLAWVANGRLTAYWEYDLSSWDIAAGSLIIQEAGGKFTDLAGNDFNLRARKVIGSNGNPGVHDELIRILRDEAGVI